MRSVWPTITIVQAAILLTPCPALAQQPVIRSVVNAISGDARFSPAMRAELKYGGSSFTAISDKVFVAGKPALTEDEEDGETLSVYLPADLSLGRADIVLQTAAGTSQPFSIVVDAYSPAISPPSQSPFLREGGKPLACNHTAGVGDILFLYAFGLGAPDAAGQLPRPVLTVGGKPVPVIEFVSSIGVPFFGSVPANPSVRLEFVVPPGDGMREVAITIAGRKSNIATMPVGRAIQNVSPTNFRQRDAASAESFLIALQCSSEGFDRRPDIVYGSLPNLPVSLADVSVQVKDSAGTERLAPLYAVYYSQINYVVPAGTQPGPALVTVVSEGRAIAEADLEIESVVPDLFQGLQVVRVHDGLQSVENVSQIDMGPEADQVYLVMYGIGIRSRSSLENVTATIGGIPVPVLYADSLATQPGVDQVNLRLPRSVAGLGLATLDLIVDGKHAAAALYIR